MKIAVAYFFIVLLFSCRTDGVPYSQEQCYKPPLTVDIELTSTNTVTISWEKGSANDPDALYAVLLKSYEVNHLKFGLHLTSTPIASFRDSGSDPFDQIYRLNPAKDQFVDADLLPATHYLYYIAFAYEDQAIEYKVNDCNVLSSLGVRIEIGGTTNTQGVFLPNNPFDN